MNQSGNLLVIEIRKTKMFRYPSGIVNLCAAKRRIMRIPIFLFAVLFGGMLNAQNHTISGHVKDGATGEDLIGAQVVVNDGSGRGALSNPYGFYSLTLPARNASDEDPLRGVCGHRYHH